MYNIESIRDILIKYAKAMKLKGTEYIYVDSIRGIVFTIDSYSYKFICIPTDEVALLLSFHGLMFNYDLLKSYTNVMEELWFVPNIGLIGDTNPIFVHNINQIHYESFHKWENCINELKEFGNLGLMTEDVYVSDNEQFHNILNMKSSEGAKPFIFDNHHVVYLFPGIIPVLKNDNVSMRIVDNGVQNFFEAIFTVHKKKMDVYVCMFCLKV